MSNQINKINLYSCRICGSPRDIQRTNCDVCSTPYDNIHSKTTDVIASNCSGSLFGINEKVPSYQQTNSGSGTFKTRARYKYL